MNTAIAAANPHLCSRAIGASFHFDSEVSRGWAFDRRRSQRKQ
jgi:hypothetical protein